VARAAPDNAFAQSLYGFMAAYRAASLPVGLRPAAIAEAREAANRALKLEPGYGDSYTIFALTTPLVEWKAREAYLRKAVSVLPDSKSATIQLIELLQNAGRFRESAPLAESVFASSPYQVRSLIEVINARLWTGQVREAQAPIQRGLKFFGGVPWFVAKGFEATAFHGAPGEAETLLRGPVATKLFETEGDAKAFGLDVIAALRLPRPANIDRVVALCKKAPGRSAEIRRTCFMALAALNRLDDAFALASTQYPDQHAATAGEREAKWLSSDMVPTAYLSIPATAPLRADPRFVDLVNRVGLLQYWKSSRRPPDFCTTEKVPVCDLIR